MKIRAEAMQYASELTAGGMMSAFFGHDSKIKLGIKTAKEYVLRNRDKGEDFISFIDCRIASHLYHNCKVIAGNLQVINYQ